ncbi:hypothetical protein, conserved [Babesia bigemina]|uniref:Uncharacterized protein n=1 Tax=Babesia bigemina TaxID=5866 RepID=A0A061DCG0_BABBI|nr:hypothetical protein, conserved [Babesia bigemina]CDR97772.1 hypothetical protein, conserved [Babesia bigemina]|eukprot:XP_012769958.1 hypothetical protein, conserved [Babesia bigemina]
MANYGVKAKSTQCRGRTRGSGPLGTDIPHENDHLQVTEDVSATHDAGRLRSSSQAFLATTSDAASAESGRSCDSLEKGRATAEDLSGANLEAPTVDSEFDVKLLQSTPEECSTDGTTNCEIYGPSYPTCDTVKLRLTSCGRGDDVSPDGDIADVEAEPDARDSATVADSFSVSSDTIENVDIDCSEFGDMGSAESYMNDSAAASSYTSDADDPANKDASDDDNADVDIECSDIEEDYGAAFGVRTGGVRRGINCADSSDSLDCSLGYSDDFSDYCETSTPASVTRVGKGGGSQVSDVSKGDGSQVSDVSKGGGSQVSDVSKGGGSQVSDVSKGGGSQVSEASKASDVGASKVRKGDGSPLSAVNSGASKPAVRAKVERRAVRGAVDANGKIRSIDSNESVKAAYNTVELLSDAASAASGIESPSSAKVDQGDTSTISTPPARASRAAVTSRSTAKASSGSKEQFTPPNPLSANSFWRPSLPPNLDVSTPSNRKGGGTPRSQGAGVRSTNDSRKTQSTSNLRQMTIDSFKIKKPEQQAPVVETPVAAAASAPISNKGDDVTIDSIKPTSNEQQAPVVETPVAAAASAPISNKGDDMTVDNFNAATREQQTHVVDTPVAAAVPAPISNKGDDMTVDSIKPTSNEQQAPVVDTPVAAAASAPSSNKGDDMTVDNFNAATREQQTHVVDTPVAAAASAPSSNKGDDMIVDNVNATRTEQKAPVVETPVAVTVSAPSSNKGDDMIVDNVNATRTEQKAPVVETPVAVTVSAPGNSRGDDMTSDSASSLTSQLVKEDVEHYVGGVEKYCMWNLNPTTGEHEFDPGPLALDFYCNACQCALPLGTFRIRCVECVDFDLCIPCACKGAEKNEHKNTHKYIPIAPNSFAIFGDWNADAELLLLEGISKFGFGNWNQVAEMVNRRCTKNKSATECENHYNEFYIHSPFSPFPDVRRMRSPVKSQEAFQRLNSFFNLVQKAHSKEKPRAYRPSGNVDENVHHVDLIPRAVNMRATVGPRLKFFQNMNGYNVYRDELEMEHNNDAESLIKDLEFEPWDTPPEIDFKLRLVEIYNSMLDDRICHKRILIHRFWHDYPAREEAFKSMNQIEKAAYWRLSPLMRLHSEEDHIKLTRLIVARIEIEKRLRLVSTWFSLGLRTFSDVQNFDMQKFPSAHAAYRNAELQPIARNLLSSGSIKETALDDFSAQLCDRICTDLCITRDQVNDVLSAVNRLNGGMPMVREPSTSVVPTWDYCFDNGKLVDRNVQRIAAPHIALDELPDPSWHPRLVLEGNGPYALPPVDFTNISFSPLSSSAVQQSQVLPGIKSCFYIAKLLPQLKARVRKNVCKRKRSLLATEPIKRGNTRR